MNKPKNYDKAQKYTQSERLPAGGYELRIENVKLDSFKGQDGQEYENLIIAFDVCSGEYTGFYRKQYDSQSGEDKKWKGTYRCPVPAEDAEESDWRLRRFKTVIASIEESNPGYHFDWNEKTLVKKIVGGLFCNAEWEMNGRSGWYTKCQSLVDVERIRSGNFKIPEDQLLEKKAEAPTPPVKTDADGFMAIPEGLDEELPFL